MNVKFYRFIAKGNDKKGGVLYSPKSWPYPIAVDGQEVKNWESLVVELKDGIYRPFQLCVGGANMVNQDLKDLLQSFIGINNDVDTLNAEELILLPSVTVDNDCIVEDGSTRLESATNDCSTLREFNLFDCHPRGRVFNVLNLDYLASHHLQLDKQCQ